MSKEAKGKEWLVDELKVMSSGNYHKEWNRAIDFAIRKANEMSEVSNVEYNRKAEIVPHIVAEWLDRENLHKASFDRVINDAFNNNGHHYIDDPEVRAWIKENSTAFKNALDYGHDVSYEQMTHEVKIHPTYLNEIVAGTKQFEIRKNDRPYNLGDKVVLLEFSDGEYTGKAYSTTITYITSYAQQEGYVVFGIKPVEEVNRG